MTSGIANVIDTMQTREELYDLVLQAVGRTPNGKKIGADKAGVEYFLQAGESDQAAEPQLNACNTMLERKPAVMITAVCGHSRRTWPSRQRHPACPRATPAAGRPGRRRRAPGRG